MIAKAPDPSEVDAAADFIARWRGTTASELSTSQSFLIEFCDLLEVPRPHPTPEQDYLFERPITFTHGDGSTSPGRVDLYRRGAFVLESKKFRSGSSKAFDEGMLRARSQAEQYARALPATEGRPPFVVVVDVGNRIELYAEFSRTGATYTPFPDPRSHRIALDDLRRPEIRARLRSVWLDPMSLDPSREAARVTRDIAAKLAVVARSLEGAGHPAEQVAQFLMRCLFTMFAEDVRLLPQDSFRDLLQRHREQPDVAMRMVAQLWRDMDGGGFSAVLAGDVLRFNGKLFKHPDTLPLDREQLAQLIDAARADWKHVEPAIFGTLLERALSPAERHKLGAHYTPRAYVERLVMPTVIEPLREEWSNAQAAALTLASEGKIDDAVAELLKFHHRLCTVRVLDPACGSGNFLYVTLEHLKRLEGEVLNALNELGHRQAGLAIDGARADALGGETVDPHNLLGIEVNPRAAAIAEVVLWIGYLQWHFRTRGDINPPQPVIRDFHNIENRDAILAWDRIEYVTDEKGLPITRWDGRTTKPSPITGEEIPDEAARVPVERYVGPRAAIWPDAEFVVGNPPFVGNKRMRFVLGEGYVEALRQAILEVPESADFVMYWWDRAAHLSRGSRIERFGLITTNSISQAFNRKILEEHLGEEAQRPRNTKRLPGYVASPDLVIAFAIPDHPWVDSSDGADVRIAMTVASTDFVSGVLREVIAEETTESETLVEFRERTGEIHADLSVGANVSGARRLTSNRNICFQGMNLVGKGFRLSADEVVAMGYDVGTLPEVIKPHFNARDFMQGSGHCYVIDFFGLSLEQARATYPVPLQRLIDRVKPERDHNKDAQRRRDWWLFGRSNAALRESWKGISRIIITPETSKHRAFAFVDLPFCPDHKLYAICSDQPLLLGVLSSTVHHIWALSAGGRLGVGNDPTWTNTTCFLTFPFPVAEQALLERLASLGEALDAHRKSRAALHPGATLTATYNVLASLRSGAPLDAKARTVHEQAVVSVVRQLHDDLDAAVLEAYGWADLLPLLRVAHGNDVPAAGQAQDDAKRAFDEAVLERLVALNAERAAEEARGVVRWLRPELQNPAGEKATQPDLVTDERHDESTEVAIGVTATKPQPWPKDAVEQVRAVADLLAASPVAMSLDDVAARFTARGPWKRRLPQLLATLVAVGRAREDQGKFNRV